MLVATLHSDFRGDLIRHFEDTDMSTTLGEKFGQFERSEIRTNDEDASAKGQEGAAGSPQEPGADPRLEAPPQQSHARPLPRWQFRGRRAIERSAEQTPKLGACEYMGQMISDDLGGDDASAGCHDDGVRCECLDVRRSEFPTQVYFDRQSLDLPEEVVEKGLVLGMDGGRHHERAAE